MMLEKELLSDLGSNKWQQSSATDQEQGEKKQNIRH